MPREGSKKESGYGFISAILIALSSAFLLFIYAPISLYAMNTMDFSFDIYDMMKFMVWIALAAFVIYTLALSIITAISRKVFIFSLGVATVAFLATAIQGIFCSNHLPLLDGSEIDWTQYSDQRIVSVAIWIALITAEIAVFRIFKDNGILNAAKYVGGFGTVFLALSLFLTIAGNSVVLNKKSDTYMTGEYVLEMSNKTNLVIILLDALSEERFDEAVSNNEEYRQIFCDFTSFSNTMGCYPHTTRAVPMILFGQWYDNSSYYPYYILNSMEKSPLFQRLDEDNYKKGVYFEYIERANIPAGTFENFVDMTQMENPTKFCKMIVMLVGLRYLPFDFKTYCVLTPDDIYFDSLKTNGTDAVDYYSFDNRDLYQRIMDNPITIIDEPCFRFLYANGAHFPFTYNKDMEQIENGTYEDGVESSMTLVAAYIDKLKEVGVYDNTILVVLADHGVNDEDPTLTEKKQHPFLMIKGLNEKHESLQINDAPISHVDLQNAYLRLMDGFSSSDCFDWKEGDERVRTYFESDVVIESDITEKESSAHASDYDALKPTGNMYIIDWNQVEQEKESSMSKIHF